MLSFVLACSAVFGCSPGLGLRGIVEAWESGNVKKWGGVQGRNDVLPAFRRSVWLAVVVCLVRW